MLYEGKPNRCLRGGGHALYRLNCGKLPCFYTYAFNKWVINPGRRTGEPVEG